MSSLSKKLGLTLTEMLVTIFILVILTVTAVPSVISFMNNHRLAATSDTLYYNLQLARMEAMKRNTTVYVSFVTGSNWCYGLNAGSTCNCSTAGSCGLGTITPPNATQSTLSASGYGSNYISFESSHGAANNSGSLTLTLYGSSSLITLSIGRFGNVTMCSTGISGYKAC